jgi:hypothetical protein
VEQGADRDVTHTGRCFCELTNNSIDLLHASDLYLAIGNIDVFPQERKLLAWSNAG